MSLEYLKKAGYLALVLLISIKAGKCFAAIEEDVPHGYLDSVSEERNLIIEEIMIVSEVKTNQKPLKDVIFNKQLTNEFKERYRFKFGETGTLQAFHPENRHVVITQEHVVNDANLAFISADDQIMENRRFADYMVKRLTEHHVDQYIKSNPAARPLYELKEKVSKIRMEVKKGYRLKINYSYSANELGVALDNPYDLENKVILRMDPDKFGPTDIDETVLYVKYAIAKDLSLSTHYILEYDDITLVGEKQVTPSLKTSLTGSSTLQDKENENSERDNRFLFGFTWIP